MDQKDNTINDSNYTKLLHDDNYYKNIFKKTEKIVSVIFYILNNTETNKKSETHVSNIASKAHFVHENALRTLEVRPASSREVLEQFAQAFVGLESTLNVANVSGLITNDVLTVLHSEIDIVLRGLKQYLKSSGMPYSSFFESLSSNVGEPVVRNKMRRSTVPINTTIDSGGQAYTPEQAKVTSRRERIKTILEAKGEATIKDISEIITDCSEKTIQRELNAMISENLIKRQGERRWSKYSLF